MKARPKRGTKRPANEVMGRPWQIVAVVFDDGSTVPVTEAKLRQYLASRDDKTILQLGMNRAATQLRSSLRRFRRNAPKIKSLQKGNETNIKDGARTERLLREAVEKLINEKTPAHKVRSLAAAEVGITRGRVDQILGPVKNTKARK